LLVASSCVVALALGLRSTTPRDELAGRLARGGAPIATWDLPYGQMTGEVNDEQLEP